MAALVRVGCVLCTLSAARICTVPAIRLMPVLTSLARALHDLLRPRILAILFLPMLGAIVLWSALAWFYWDAWSAWLRIGFDETCVGRWLVAHGASWLLNRLSAVLVIALLLPAVFVTAIVITELIAMPVIV